jgi:acetylornithine deacetylase/succinyl-diaminopimelate desuccinylase-like protein
MSRAGDLDRVRAVAQAHRGSTLAGLCQFMRFRTISSTAEGREEIRRCARWLASYLRWLGFDQVETPVAGGIPVIIARMTGSLGPRVLIYGHYDVVTSGPLEEWRHHPFAGVVKAGRLHGRGASDDKGPVWAHLCAISAWRRSGRMLPIEVIVVLDGEEEIGSPHLAKAIVARLQPRTAAVTLVSDTRMLGPNRPVLISRLRGSVTLGLSLQAPGRELHAGAFGGAVINPAEVLARVVASLHDRDGEVAVPGFYSSVARISPSTRAVLRQQGPADAELRATAGGAILSGPRKWTALERTTVRPAVVTTGMIAGGSGEGGRNSIPRSAQARLNLRLVPAQNPLEEAKRLARHIRRLIPPGISVRLDLQSSTPPTAVDVNHPVARKVAAALEDTYGQAVAYLPSGGSIPAVAILQQLVGAPVVLMGFSQPNDGVHGVDESFSIAGLWRATDACIRTYQRLGSLYSTKPARQLDLAASERS